MAGGDVAAAASERGSLAALKMVGGIVSPAVPFLRTGKDKGKHFLQKNAHVILSNSMHNKYKMETIQTCISYRTDKM